MTTIDVSPFPAGIREQVMLAIVYSGVMPGLSGNYSAEFGFELPLTADWITHVKVTAPNRSDLLPYHSARQLRFRQQGDMVTGLRCKDDLPYWSTPELDHIKDLCNLYSVKVKDPLSIYNLVQTDDWCIFDPRFPSSELSERRTTFYRRYGIRDKNDVKYGLLTREIAVLRDHPENMTFFQLCNRIEKQYTRFCCTCLAAAGALRKCGACRQVRYCSIACQRQNWGDHRDVCQKSVADSSPSPTSSSLNNSVFLDQYSCCSSRTL
jgi:hypothetical protein